MSETMNITHILVPYKGSEIEDELLRMTCRIARQIKARVLIVHVLEVPMALALDAHNVPGTEEGEALLEHAEEVASESGVRVETELLKDRSAGHAVVEEARSVGADLVIMEATPERGTGIPTVGYTAEYILKHAPCNVWISHLVNSNGHITGQRK
jgi:nucleotide-binding universal stress UspA family protein